MKSRELLRRQLDARLQNLSPVPPPRDGWVRTVRRALGMTLAQLGTRLGVSSTAVAELEAREARGAATVAKLRDAADALGCDLMIAFVPRISLTEMIRRQATSKAQLEHRQLLHTMKLEAQDEGIDESADVDRSIERWMEKPPARLWD